MQVIGAGGVDDDPVRRIGRDDRRETLQHPHRQPFKRGGIGGRIRVLDRRKGRTGNLLRFFDLIPIAYCATPARQRARGSPCRYCFGLWSSDAPRPRANRSSDDALRVRNEKTDQVYEA